ncbi:uncharacterized protein LOC143767765 [Ranitomeya variabilis]|uniref:uncharacterized protein LOC143767765 n=1 Tax=Ranitomeya variabilis TaxID=490064 RepID=UPI00405729C4
MWQIFAWTTILRTGTKQQRIPPREAEILGIKDTEGPEDAIRPRDRLSGREKWQGKALPIAVTDCALDDVVLSKRVEVKVKPGCDSLFVEPSAEEITPYRENPDGIEEQHREFRMDPAKLALPQSFKIHNVFHHSLLKRFVASSNPSPSPPSPVLVDGNLEFQIARVMDSRLVRRSLQYLVPEGDEDLIENEHLISLVHERVALWDTRDPLHANNVTIRRLWNEVAAALWDGWANAPARVRSAFVSKVKTRWRSMKDRFNKDLRQESQLPSGSAARIRKYKYHRILAFLRPVLAQRTTWSSTVGPGSGAVLHQSATDPSQPSSSAAASGPATQPGDQEAGPSGVPLPQSSASSQFFMGFSRQRQRAADRSLMPEFLHLSSVFHEGLKAMGDRLDTAISHMSTRIQEVTTALAQVKADLQRPAHHFFNQIEQGMSEHLSPELQITVMQACNAAYVLFGIFSRQWGHFQQCPHCHALHQCRHLLHTTARPPPFQTLPDRIIAPPPCPVQWVSPPPPP